MNEVKRFDLIGTEGFMDECDCGDFVRHSDHLAAMREKDAEIALGESHLVEAMRTIAEQDRELERAEAQRDALLKRIRRICSRRKSTEETDSHSEQWRQGFACAANMLRELAHQIEQEKGA